jgi:dihydrofolate reductase
MIRQPLNMILALADDGTLGDKGGIPWDLPADRTRFRKLTMGHAVIMGRRTWESLPEHVRPFKGRRSIVVSRRGQIAVDKCHSVGEAVEVWGSLDGAIAAARTTDPEPFIAGGVEIYWEALHLATRIYLTEVHLSPGGDTRFAFDRGRWISEGARCRRCEAGTSYTFLDLVRR